MAKQSVLSRTSGLGRPPKTRPANRGLGPDAGDERDLLGRLDGLRAVIRTHPGDRVDRLDAAQYGQASKRCSGAPMCPNASHFNALAAAGPFERCTQCSHDLISLRGDSEVRPFEVRVWPGWVPLRVEIQTVVGIAVAPVRVGVDEGDRRDQGSVREDYRVLMLMDLYLASAVDLVNALWRLVDRPVHVTVSADLNGCGSHRHDVSRGDVAACLSEKPGLLKLWLTLSVWCFRCGEWWS
jgi:hypothetical protein